MPAWEAFDHYENLVRKVARDYPQVRIVNPMDFFCDDSFCHLAKDGVLLYQDRSHLNANGSKYVAPLIMEKIGQPE